MKKIFPLVLISIEAMISVHLNSPFRTNPFDHRHSWSGLLGPSNPAMPLSQSVYLLLGLFAFAGGAVVPYFNPTAGFSSSSFHGLPYLHAKSSIFTILANLP